jgi:hypothetical protein
MTEDKYLAIQALELFDGVKDRMWKWLFDAEQDYKHTTAIMFFILGALVVYIVPDAPDYAVLAAVALFILLFIFCCLVPVALLVEWALRKVSSAFH